MSKIGDTTPRSIVSSCGSSRTPRPPLVCTSRIVRQDVQQTPMPIPSEAQNLRGNSLGGVSETVTQDVEQTPMPTNSYTVIRPKIQNLGGSSLGNVSKTATPQETPRQESGDIEARIQDFQDLKAENSFIRQFTRQQLSWLTSITQTIPITDPTIEEACNTLLEMADRKVIMSQKDEDKESARQKLISLVDSGEKTLEVLEQKILEQYPDNEQRKIQINRKIRRIRNIIKETCDFIQCFNLDKMTKELDQSKTYDDLLKMRNDFKKQDLKTFFMSPLDKNIYAIERSPDKNRQAARLINILKQIRYLDPYIAASEQASSSNVMRRRESGTSRE